MKQFLIILGVAVGVCVLLSSQKEKAPTYTGGKDFANRLQAWLG